MEFLAASAASRRCAAGPGLRRSASRIAEQVVYEHEHAGRCQGGKYGGDGAIQDQHGYLGCMWNCAVTAQIVEDLSIRHIGDDPQTLLWVSPDLAGVCGSIQRA